MYLYYISCLRYTILFGNPRYVTYRSSQVADHLIGLVVKASASGAEDPGFKSHLQRDFSGSSHTTDLEISTPVATLPGAWRYRVSAGTGWPSVSGLKIGTPGT